MTKSSPRFSYVLILSLSLSPSRELYYHVTSYLGVNIQGTAGGTRSPREGDAITMATTTANRIYKKQNSAVWYNTHTEP